MANILLSIIAGLILVLIVKTEHPEETHGFKDFILTVLINYLMPLIFALILAGIIYWVASLFNSYLG
jgi:hypothetical protein